MTVSDDFEYVRTLDMAKVDAPDRTGQFMDRLLHLENGARACTVQYICTPSGQGTPYKMHVHDFDQICFILEGTMSVNVDGRDFEAPANSLVVFPPGVPHSYVNRSTVELRHLSINAPADDPHAPHARSVGQ